MRYGGNTSCVSLRAPGHDPLLFDLGTGLRYFGRSAAARATPHTNALLSHYHWDHIQGLPFFAPLLRAGSRVDVYGPRPCEERSIVEVMRETIRPPLFPVGIDELPGAIEFHEIDSLEPGAATFEIPGSDADAEPLEVCARRIPHVGVMAGYRVTWKGRSVSYLSDHQQPMEGPFTLADGARELCEGTDVLIHDAQYTAAEFARRRDWGHCTVEYAVWVASETRAKTLVLFHHDPQHDDELIDVLQSAAASCGRAAGVEVVAAHEGLVLQV